jgi:hypothetical protein
LKQAAVYIGLCLLAASPAFAGEEHKELAGHYYLSGVMEVGAGLRLKEDGSYEWFMSYGSVDQFSKGTWRVDARGVQLISAKPSDGRTPVTLDGAYEWSSTAEYRLRTNMAALEDQKRTLRCPSVDMGDTAYSAAVPGTAQAEGAAAALRPLTALRIAAEKAAELSAGNPNDKGLRAASDAAVKAFWDQHALAQDLADASGSTFPDVALPEAPASCRPENTEISRSIPAADWVGQQAVVVIDPTLDLAIPDLGVRIDYTNGQTAEGRTDGRGAFIPLPQIKADVTTVTLTYAKSQLSPVVIPIARKGRVLVILNFDYRAAVPAFETMALTRAKTRAKTGLRPEGEMRGVYVRGGDK